MNNKIHYIKVKNNEIFSSNLILKLIKKNKVLFIHQESNPINEFLDNIKIDGPAVILKSSGSSKKSKICIHPIYNLNKSAESSGTWLKSQGFNLSKCIVFNTLPLNHISSLMALWRSQVWHCEYINISPHLIKNTKDLMDFSLSIRDINNKKLITSLVPTQLFRLFHTKEGLNWLKLFDLIWVGGAHISNNLFENCKKEKINLAPCYGATETAAMVTSLKPSEFLSGLKNYGTKLEDIQLRINNEGIIEISSERIGYELKSSSEIKQFSNKGGWWESGDFGKLIKINNIDYLQVLGRKDNAFQSGGETIFPDVIKIRINDFIYSKKIPIKDLLICKKEDQLWGNRFEIMLNFDDDTNQKEIKKSINELDNFSRNWPSHEKPLKWIISDDKSIFDQKSNITWKNKL